MWNFIQRYLNEMPWCLKITKHLVGLCGISCRNAHVNFKYLTSRSISLLDKGDIAWYSIVSHIRGYNIEENFMGFLQRLGKNHLVCTMLYLHLLITMQILRFASDLGLINE